MWQGSKFHSSVHVVYKKTLILSLLSLCGLFISNMCLLIYLEIWEAGVPMAFTLYNSQYRYSLYVLLMASHYTTGDTSGNSTAALVVLSP